MKKIIYIIGIITVISCQNKSNDKIRTDSTSSERQSQPVIVYDTVYKKLNEGQQLLVNVRKKLRRQKDDKFEIKTSEKQKMAKLLLKYKRSMKLTEKELQEFLMIDPSDLKNFAELSQMYNEALFKVVQNNNKMFARQLIKKPTLSQKLSLELVTPVNDNISKDFILKNALNEYQIQIDNRINELEDEELIIQYYMEKKKVFKEFEGKESDIKTPQKIQEIDKTRIEGFEKAYKVENRIPDEGMGFASGGSRVINQPVGDSSIELENVKVDLSKLKSENLLEQSINQKKLRELQKTNQLQKREGGG